MVCSNMIKRGDYALEAVKPPASAHRDGYMLCHLESTSYRNRNRNRNGSPLLP